jgi:hypothetical protein
MDLSFGRVRHWVQFTAGALNFTRSSVSAPASGGSGQDFADGVVAYGSNASRVELAFSEHPPNWLEAKAIRALIDNSGSTGAQLSETCGWRPSGWWTHMLVTCHRRKNELWPDGLPYDVPVGFALTAIVNYEPSTLQFWMRDDVIPVLAPRV